MSEREVSRLAQDLKTGNAEDAVRTIQQELQVHPQSVLQEIRQANALAGPNARMHIGQKQDGDMAIVDQSGRPVAHLGHLGQQNQGRYQDQSYLNSQNGRYQDHSYLNSQNGRNQDQSYLNSQNGRYQDQSYLNSQNGRYQDQSYLNGQNGRYQDQSYLQGNNGQIGRLANDLARGDARDAANVMRTVLASSYDDPTRVIQEANRLADQQAARMGYRSAMEHIGINRRNGDLAIVGQDGYPIARLGNINDQNRNQQTYGVDPRYSPVQNNSSYYQDRQQSGYYNNDQQNYYNNDQQRYYDNNRMSGGNAALNIGIGVIGGLILSNIGRNNHNNNNNNNNFHRGRH